MIENMFQYLMRVKYITKSNEPPRPTNAKPVTFQFPSGSKDQDHYYNLVNDLFMNDLKVNNICSYI